MFKGTAGDIQGRGHSKLRKQARQESVTFIAFISKQEWIHRDTWTRSSGSALSVLVTSQGHGVISIVLSLYPPDSRSPHAGDRELK